MEVGSRGAPCARRSAARSAALAHDVNEGRHTVSMPRQRTPNYQMKAAGRRWRGGLICAGVSALLAMLGGEVVVRTLGSSDADGNFWYRDTHVPPRRLPKEKIQRLAAELERGPTYLRYDEQLGWSIRPGFTSRDGMYLANRAGLRDLATDLAPLDSSSRYRVAIFGDSFVHATTYLTTSRSAISWKPFCDRVE